MDGSYYFKPLDPRVEKCNLEKLACVHPSIKDNPMGMKLVNAQAAVFLLILMKDHDISSSLMKQTLPGEGKSIPTNTPVEVAGLEVPIDVAMG